MRNGEKMLEQKRDLLLTMDEVADLFRCSRHTIRLKFKKDPDFPKPIRQPGRGTNLWWIEAEIQEYIQKLKAARK